MRSRGAAQVLAFTCMGVHFLGNGDTITRMSLRDAGTFCTLQSPRSSLCESSRSVHSTPSRLASGVSASTNTYTLLCQSRPVLDILAAMTHSSPAIKHDPDHIWAYRYPPLSRDTSTPPMGDPVNKAKLATVNPIPIRVPVLLKSPVSVDKGEGHNPWMPLAKKPISTANA